MGLRYEITGHSDAPFLVLLPPLGSASALFEPRARASVVSHDVRGLRTLEVAYPVPSLRVSPSRAQNCHSLQLTNCENHEGNESCKRR